MVLYASIGSGHKKAAEAIVESLVSGGERHDVCLIDVLSLMNPLYRNLVPRGYIWLARYFPPVLGFLYRFSDHSFSILPPARFFRSLLSRLFSSGFKRFVREFSPKMIVCTHFLPMELLSSDLISEGSPLLYVSITDIIPHAFWVAPGVERYFVAADESVKRMKDFGVPEEKISVSGIPVHPSFKRARVACPAVAERAVPLKLLVVAGGAGVGPIEKLLEGLSGSHPSISVTVVAGSNRALFRRVFRKRFSYSFPVEVRRYTKRMSLLMEQADLVLTKPGGLTTAECLAIGKPMILFSPIPGQEEDNLDILKAWGVAKSLSPAEKPPCFLEDLLKNRQELFSMEERARERGRPDASRVVCQEILLSFHETRSKDGGSSLSWKLYRAGRWAFSKWF